MAEFNTRLLTLPDVTKRLPHNVLEARWMGYSGASEQDLQVAESRLGIVLPPSYRTFLHVSNGWRGSSPFIHHIWCTNRIDWFSSRHNEWIREFAKAFERTPRVEDEEYFDYSANQDPSSVRVEYLSKMLEISDVGDAAIYLLNPSVVSQHGEWEAWFFASWLPGANRYASFADLMLAELRVIEKP